MKNLNLFRSSGIPGLFSAIVIFSMVFTSCKKDDDDDLILEGEAKVMVVNSAPNSQPQDFYVNDTKVTASAVAYNQSSSYTTVDAGYGVKAEFKSAGSATANFTGHLDLLPNEKYTFFYTTQANGSGSSSAAFRDEQTASSNRAKVRFVNLVTGLAGANLIVTGGSTFASNVPFGSSSTFIEIDPGTYAFQTALSGGTSAGINVGEFALQAGKIYTIYTSGSTSTSVSGNLLIHN